MQDPKRNQITGTAVAVPGNDIDTDRSIPARFLRSHQRDLCQIRLKSFGEIVDLLALTFLQAFSRKDRTLSKRKVSKAAGTFNHRLQCFAALDWIPAGKAHFTVHLHILLRTPQREFLDNQMVERLQFDICRCVSGDRALKVDLDQLGSERRQQNRRASRRSG